LLVRDFSRRGLHLGPLPPPGTYARHNAVDTPALLPDGTTADASVNRVLAAQGPHAWPNCFRIRKLPIRYRIRLSPH